MMNDTPWTQVFGFSVLDHVPVGCCVLNARMEVVFWNKVLERWTHIDRWDILHRPVTEIFPQLGQRHYKIRLKGIFLGGPPLILSSHLHGQIFPSTCADGHRRLQQTTVTSIPTHDGSGCLACLAVEDVSEVTRRIADLRRTRDQARRAFEVKSQFMATMSHELRTPLNSILLMSRVLMENREGHFSEADTQSLGIVHQSGEALLQLVDDILDLSKVEAGKREAARESLDLRALLQEVVDSTGPLVTHAGLDFQFSCAEDVPRMVVTDAQALTRILRNLLSNAAKFAGKGTVALRVGLEPPVWLEGGRNMPPWLTLSVQDQGPGIALDKQEAVFEPFCQEDQTISRRYGGTGLGLSISRQLADLLGGRLSLVSEPGKGAAFTLHLPLQAHTAAGAGGDKESRFRIESTLGPEAPPASSGPEGAPAEPVVPQESRHLEGRTILLVGEDMRELFTLSGVLEGVKARVLTARSVARARALLQEDDSVEVMVMNVSSCSSDHWDEAGKTALRQLAIGEGVDIICTAQAGGEDLPETCRDCTFARPILHEDLLSNPVETIEKALLQQI